VEAYNSESGTAGQSPNGRLLIGTVKLAHCVVAAAVHFLAPYNKYVSRKYPCAPRAASRFWKFYTSSCLDCSIFGSLNLGLEKDTPKVSFSKPAPRFAISRRIHYIVPLEGPDKLVQNEGVDDDSPQYAPGRARQETVGRIA
jgi:hypothetical protein